MYEPPSQQDFPASAPTAPLRRRVRRLLGTARRVDRHCRDILPPELLQELRTTRERLRELAAARAHEASICEALAALQLVIGRIARLGPRWPHVSRWAEYVFVVVFVWLGVRQYVAQPYLIPTNSMWPTYAGMHATVYADTVDEPDALRRLWRWATCGAQPVRVDAPDDGEVLLPIGNTDGGLGLLHGRRLGDPIWGVWPDRVREHRLLVGVVSVPVRVPESFDLDEVLRGRFFPESVSLGVAVRACVDEGRTVERELLEGGQRVRITCVRTGVYLHGGQRVLSFDILPGDRLLVEQVSQHFVSPGIGEPVVFATDGVPELLRTQEGGRHLLKRVVGLPGDQLEIHGTTLYRNGDPIAGAPAFAANAARSRGYAGYLAVGRLSRGHIATVPAGCAFVMGDNSPDSYDSRYWGYVPLDDIEGRPFFIYHPFSGRWGFAQ